MPVARLGTYTLHQQSSNGSIALTVPSDASVCVVIVTGHPGSTGVPMFSGLNWDGSGLDFTLIRTQYWGSSDAQIGAYYMTSASANWPGSGSKTLYYTSSGYGEGYNILVLFYSGVDTSSPLVGSDGSNNTTSNWTSNITGVGAADMGIVAAYNWVDSGTVVNSNGQTQIVNTALYNYSVLAAGEKAATGALTVGRTSGDIIPLAFVLRAATAGGTTHDASLALAAIGSVSDSAAVAFAAFFSLTASGGMSDAVSAQYAVAWQAAATVAMTPGGASALLAGLALSGSVGLSPSPSAAFAASAGFPAQADIAPAYGSIVAAALALEAIGAMTPAVQAQFQSALAAVATAGITPGAAAAISAQFQAAAVAALLMSTGGVAMDAAVGLPCGAALAAGSFAELAAALNLATGVQVTPTVLQQAFAGLDFRVLAALVATHPDDVATVLRVLVMFAGRTPGTDFEGRSPSVTIQ